MKKQKHSALILYIVSFFLLWALFELTAIPALNALIPQGITRQLLQDGLIENLVWTLPAVCLIHRFPGNVSLNEMFINKIAWLKYLPVFGIFTLYLLVGAFLQKGVLTLSPDFGMEQVIIVLFVGLTEEMVFRGWLLNTGDWENRKWLNLLVNAGLFLLIHFPIWIREGVFIRSFTDLSFLSIIALSFVFGWSFIKSRNILVPITLHMYWDLLVFLFY